MRTTRKIVSVLRAAGVVLLCLSMVFSLYGIATSSTLWGEMSAKLSAAGVRTGIMDRISYDSTLYLAMNKAYSVRTDKVSVIYLMFADWEAKGTSNVDTVREEAFTQAVNAFDASFDKSAFIARMENREKLSEKRVESDVFTYLDDLNIIAGPKGKVMKNKDAAPASSYVADLYATMKEERGEEAVGNYVEFLHAIQRVCEEAQSSKVTWKDTKAWLSENLTAEVYDKAIAIIRSEDKASDASVLDQFVEALEAGQDTAAFTAACYEAMVAKGGPECPQNVFAAALFDCLNNTGFDGSWTTLISAVKSGIDAEAADSFPAFLTVHCEHIAETVDQRANIVLVDFLWLLVSAVRWLWLASILLIITARLLQILMENLVMRSLQGQELPQEEDDTLLRVEHLSQYFRNGDTIQKAVDNVSFSIKKGEVLGLVGESGCGKTTTGRTIINLYDPTTGDVYFHGLRISTTRNGIAIYRKQRRRDRDQAIRDLQYNMKEAVKAEPDREAELKEKLQRDIDEERRKCAADIDTAEIHALESSVEKKRCTQLYREHRKAELTKAYQEDLKDPNCNKEERKRRYQTEMKVAARDNVMARMQMIFQDPIASINPRMTVREIIAEGMVIQGIKDKEYINNKVNEMLELVGLVREHADRYPHEFSGGQRQRIGIARAIVMQPDLIIADEPISALDVSIQAQVINLMNELRNTMGLTIMFIAHNLSVVKYFSDRIAVMYFGKIVELTTSEELFAHPLHPYTRSLLSAIPYPDPYHEKQRKRVEYHPDKEHDYRFDKPSMHEIVPGHFIYCNEQELAVYRKELGL